MTGGRENGLTEVYNDAVNAVCDVARSMRYILTYGLLWRGYGDTAAIDFARSGPGSLTPRAALTANPQGERNR